MTDPNADELLRRFHNCIEQVSWLMIRSFEPLHLEYEDVKAEANILICVYAGLMPSMYSGHEGILPQLVEAVEGDGERLQALMSEQLRRDLTKHYARESVKRIAALDIDNLPERLVHNDEDFESRTISQMLLRTEMRERYPYLCKKYLDDITEQEIADDEGTPYRTVKYRVAAEKQAAREDPDMYDVIAPEVRANIPLYATTKNHDDIPSPAQIWAWNVAGLCVECGGTLGLHAVKNACSLECWNFARGRRTEAERKQWDYFFWYGLYDGDPRLDYPEGYAYEGWASWAMNDDNKSQYDMEIVA